LLATAPNHQERKHMDRRVFLRNAASAAAILSMNRLRAQPAAWPLKSCVRAGVRLGAQATWDDLKNPAFAAFLAENFNALTAGHELKCTSFLRPSPTTYNFTRADAMVEFAERHGMHFHGHNLCWNQYLPWWVNGTLTRSNAAHYLHEHITTVVKRYGSRVGSWDVVNEPPLQSPRILNGPQAPRPWLDLIGPTYLDVAFHAAAAADSRPLRVLNLGNLEQSNWNDGARAQALKLVEDLLKRDVPIQAIGLESHLNATEPVENDSQNSFIQAIRSHGLKILITELDINDAKVPGDFTHRDEAVARAYSDYLLKIVPRTGTEQVIFWTPWDGSDWLDSMHGPWIDRADFGQHRPGLIDAGMRRKASFYAVADALRRTLG
jgi:endo-1,4-beta-xylanase